MKPLPPEVANAKLNARTVCALAGWTPRQLARRIKADKFPPGKIDGDGTRRWRTDETMAALKEQS